MTSGDPRCLPVIELPRDARVVFPFQAPREIWARKRGLPFMRILTNAERRRLRFDTIRISRVLSSIRSRA